MNKHLVVIIYKHRNFGFLASPYIVSKKQNKVFFDIEERILSLNIDYYDFTPEQKSIIKKCDDLSDKNIVKIFDRKKNGFASFFNNLTTNYINNNIRPYIELRLTTIFDLVRKNNIPLYMVYERTKTLFPEDELITSKQSAEALFNFTKTENSFHYFLSIYHNERNIKLTGQPGEVITNEECYLVVKNRLYHIADINGKKINPFFIKEYISIPKSAEKKYFETFVLNNIKKYKVKATGFDVDNVQPEPEAHLSLENDLNNLPVFILKFKYSEKCTFYRNSNSASFVEMHEENANFRFFKIYRNLDHEKTIAYLLANLGLLEIKLGQFIPQQEKDKTADFYNFIDWLRTNKQKLNDNNILVRQNNIDKKYYLEKPELNFKVKSKIDWFDIFAKVKCGDFTFPFFDFSHNILNGIKDFLLPNGEYIFLPNEWFEKYEDFFLHAQNTNNGMQVKKQHIGVLRKIYSSHSSEYLEKILSLGSLFSQQQIELPSNLEAKLRLYQHEGFSWLYFLQQNNFGGCLADDMGLGKTLQTLTLLLKTVKTKGLLREVKEENKNAVQLSLFDPPEKISETEKKELEYRSQAVLIVMPTSLIHNWENEIRKFTPSFRVLKYVGGNRAAYKSVHKTFYNYDIILASYGVIRNDIDYLRDYNFFYTILDESQYIKNPDSKTYKAITQLNSLHKLVLTGTPIENSLKDFWAQMNFINPGLLGSFNFFKIRYLNPIEKGIGLKQQRSLKTLIQPFILRRTKQNVAKDLPALTDQEYFVNMSDEQNEIYILEKNRIRNSIISSIANNDSQKVSMAVLSGLSRLRQLSNHPFLIDEDYKNSSGKFDEVCRLIENLIAENHKLLIFSSFVSHLNIFANHFEKNNWKYSILTGKTTKRKTVIDEFQNDKDNRLFLISIKAGGVGLNLTAADYIFILDPWWNPAVELQAINRAHRIGQDKKVFVYRFITKNTIEEKIQLLQKKKSKLADMFINSNNPFSKMDQETMMELLN